MSYIRLYPKKNNTIFKRNNKLWSESTNTGKNPIMELYDGDGRSKLLFQFVIPNELKQKLETFDSKINFQLFDAGTLYQPGLKLKNLKLSAFSEEFAEGDGYSFQRPKNLLQVSNWLYRQNGQSWDGIQFSEIEQKHLDSINEDLKYSVETYINAILQEQAEENQDDLTINLALEVAEIDEDIILYTKFIYSTYTKTVFQPYLEFFIEDNISDNRRNLTGGVTNKIYLLNTTGKPFVGVVTANVILNNNSIISPIIQHVANSGTYWIEIEPINPRNNLSKEHVIVTWKIDDVIQSKDTIVVHSSNQILNDTQLNKNLFFYPITPYTYNTIRVGDIVPFEIISQIRGIGDVVNNDYEYRVISADGFEMVPWQKVSNYQDKMFFNIDTSFFYPENNYELFIRNKNDNFSITSNQTYKFKVSGDYQSHLRDVAASPYFSREQYFGK